MCKAASYLEVMAKLDKRSLILGKKAMRVNLQLDEGEGVRNWTSDYMRARSLARDLQNIDVNTYVKWMTRACASDIRLFRPHLEHSGDQE